MKSLFMTAAIAAIALCSCGGNATQATEAEQNDSTAVVENTVIGKWDIENVVLSDSVYARPAEIDTVEQYISFEEDSTYSIGTNCNTINGSFVVNGDSIVINPGPSTRMMCENMQVEDLLMQILPEISTIDFENDSTLRLNGTEGKYIVLRKAAE